MQKNKKSKRAVKKNSAKKWMLLFGGIIILCAILFLTGNIKNEKSSEFITQIESYQGYTRVISEEEQDFYTYFVKRDLGENVSDDDMKELVEDYINKVSAVFFLGNKLGISEPYSFDLLKLRMEQENRNRQLKKEQGEVLYGIEQFTLQTYYQYERENIESDIIAYLEENVDQGILNMAEEYYKENEELFIGRESVVYEVTEEGITSEVEADRNQMDFLGNADRGLADFLEVAEVGDVYEDKESGSNRSIVLKEVTHTERGFKKNREYVVSYYIKNVLLEKAIEIVAKNNPVELL